MSDIISKIDTIKYSIYKKQQEMTQIKELEKLLNSPFINKNDIQIIENRILELKSESLNNNLKGIDKLKKFRLDSKKTSQINDEVQFIYPNFLEVGKTTMVFGESGIGKTLFMLAFANYALLNKNIASVISLDFDNGLKSLKKRKYDNLAEKWGEGVFDYLVPKYIDGIIFGAIVESFASEQGARRTAMESATDNAEDMIGSLQLKYNRARQATITQEISEIVAGAEALK